MKMKIFMLTLGMSTILFAGVNGGTHPMFVLGENGGTHPVFVGGGGGTHPVLGGGGGPGVVADGGGAGSRSLVAMDGGTMLLAGETGGSHP
jgi:hypothetical protein